MLISIEFDRTCDLPGMGPGKKGTFKISQFKVTGKPIFRRTKRIKNEICIPRMHL